MGQPGRGYPGLSGYDSNRCPTWLLLASLFFVLFLRRCARAQLQRAAPPYRNGAIENDYVHVHEAIAVMRYR